MTVSELKNKLQDLLKKFNQSNKAAIKDISIERAIEITTAFSEFKEYEYEFEFKIV